MYSMNVNLKDTDGKIKPMNAVNNGPVGMNVRGTTNFEDYKAARIPFARNHDASAYSGYGGDHTVDVHRIFRNFDADENDPSNYIFEPTDKYTAAIIAAGTKPFYRLGATIEHGYKFGTYPPKDFLKWARICEHIIMHYNEGWADGFHYGIEYWEIWNEPDCFNADGSNPCWQGTPEQFGEFFEISFKYLKTRFPNLKIGGPAIGSTWKDALNEKYFTWIKSSELKPDFYSYHWYGCETAKFVQSLEKAREVADEYFGKDAETILNEWNYIRGWSGENWNYSLENERGIKGASFTTAIMSLAQAGPLDMLMYYDARPSGMNGMFYMMDLHILKGYYPIANFSDLAELGTYVKTESGNDIYSVAATNGTEAALLVTHYNDDDSAPAQELELNFEGLCGGKKEIEYYLLDETHDSKLVRKERFTSESFTAYLDMPLFTTYLIKIKTV